MSVTSWMANHLPASMVGFLSKGASAQTILDNLEGIEPEKLKEIAKHVPPEKMAEVAELARTQKPELAKQIGSQLDIETMAKVAEKMKPETAAAYFNDGAIPADRAFRVASVMDPAKLSGIAPHIDKGRAADVALQGLKTDPQATAQLASGLPRDLRADAGLEMMKKDPQTVAGLASSGAIPRELVVDTGIGMMKKDPAAVARIANGMDTATVQRLAPDFVRADPAAVAGVAQHMNQGKALDVGISLAKENPALMARVLPHLNADTAANFAIGMQQRDPQALQGMLAHVSDKEAARVGVALARKDPDAAARLVETLPVERRLNIAGEMLSKDPTAVAAVIQKLPPNVIAETVASNPVKAAEIGLGAGGIGTLLNVPGRILEGLDPRRIIGAASPGLPQPPGAPDNTSFDNALQRLVDAGGDAAELLAGQLDSTGTLAQGVDAVRDTILEFLNGNPVGTIGGIPQLAQTLADIGINLPESMRNVSSVAEQNVQTPVFNNTLAAKPAA